MWDLIVSVPDHCLSFYSESASTRINEENHFIKYFKSQLNALYL